MSDLYLWFMTEPPEYEVKLKQKSFQRRKKPTFFTENEMTIIFRLRHLERGRASVTNQGRRGRGHNEHT